LFVADLANIQTKLATLKTEVSTSTLPTIVGVQDVQTDINTLIFQLGALTTAPWYGVVLGNLNAARDHLADIILLLQVY